MPIVDVELVLGEKEGMRPRLARDLADRLGEVFGSPPGQTWVRLRAIAQDAYAESGAPASAPSSPIFVGVLKAKLPPTERMGEEASRITETVAQVCVRPRESVHVLYLPEASGRLALGGQMVGESASAS